MSAPVVTIFKNGDNHFQGKRLVVNRKEIRNFEALLDKITKDTRSQIAVRSLRTPNHGHKVDDVEKLENGGVYVAVGPERFKKLRYNEIRALPVNRQKVDGQIIKPVIHSRVIVSGRARKVAAAEPLSNRIIQVYRNGDDRHSAIKILLDKRILKSMENVLQYISDKVNLRTGAVRSLYSIDGVIVESAGQIESGQKYVAVGFGKRFMKVHYSEGGSHSLTPRRNRSTDALQEAHFRAGTKNSYSPDRSLKRVKPRRLRTHPQDKESIKRENKYQTQSVSESPNKFQNNRTRFPSNKSSDPPSPHNVSVSDDSPAATNTPSSRKNSTGNKSEDEGSKSSPFHSSVRQKTNTFALASNENQDTVDSTEEVDAAEVVDADETSTKNKDDDVFKATGNQGEKAQAVRDDNDTHTEKPIDMQAAEEVDEDIEELPENDNKANDNVIASQTSNLSEDEGAEPTNSSRKSSIKSKKEMTFVSKDGEAESDVEDATESVQNSADSQVEKERKKSTGKPVEEPQPTSVNNS